MPPLGLPDGKLCRCRGGVSPVGQRREVDLAPLAVRTNRLGVTQKTAAQAVVLASGKVSGSVAWAALHCRVQCVAAPQHCPPTPAWLPGGSAHPAC